MLESSSMVEYVARTSRLNYCLLGKREKYFATSKATYFLVQNAILNVFVKLKFVVNFNQKLEGRIPR